MVIEAYYLAIVKVNISRKQAWYACFLFCNQLKINSENKKSKGVMQIVEDRGKMTDIIVFITFDLNKQK